MGRRGRKRRVATIIKRAAAEFEYKDPLQQKFSKYEIHNELIDRIITELLTSIIEKVKATGLTARQVSERAGIYPYRMNRLMESELRDIKVEDMVRIAIALGYMPKSLSELCKIFALRDKMDEEDL